jgi:outer membrane receptor protein involved in Fe transport
VVQLLSRDVDRRRLELEASGGSLNGRLLAGFASERWEDVGVSVEGEWLSSGGYVPVFPGQRGAIDAAARSRHGNAVARVEYRPSASLETWARLGYFDEAQNGGTRYTTAEVRLWQASTGARALLSEAGQLDATLFIRTERFSQSRARIAPERASEALSARQRVPAEDWGTAWAWTSRALRAGGTHQLGVGLDVRRVSGTSEETLFPSVTSPSSVIRRDSGGQQWFGAAFVQDQYSPTDTLFLSGALRLDGWRNLAGRRETHRSEEPVELATFAPRTESQLSPRLGAMWRPWEPLAFRIMGARAFRAPTLNELYRPFQVGTVLTAANEQLAPERLWELEAGVDVQPWDVALFRATGFWNTLDAPITNVTLDPVPANGPQRQRQNLGSARIQGLELSAQARLLRRWTLLGGYTFVAAGVRSAPNQAELLGKRLAQAPAHRVSGSLAFADQRLFRALVQVQWLGPQFEDDLNTLRMGGYAVLDASVSRTLWGPVELFASAENLLGRQYLVGRAGIDTIGPPRTLWLGLRLGLEQEDGKGDTR